MFSHQRDIMMITAHCIRLLTLLILVLGAHIQVSDTQRYDETFRISTDRLQFFEYGPVYFHCEAPDGLMPLRGIRNNEKFIKNCDMKRTSTLICTIKVAYDADSGVYWCETERGEKSNAVNITVTGGYVILESPALPVMEGDEVTLSCRSKTKSTNLRADFYKDDVLLKNGPAEEMTINSVSKSDEGLYKCSIPDVGTSPGSWLTVRENHPFHRRRSPHVFIPLWVAVTISAVAFVLLLMGFLHRGGQEANLAVYSKVTYVVVKTQEGESSWRGVCSQNKPQTACHRKTMEGERSLTAETPDQRIKERNSVKQSV